MAGLLGLLGVVLELLELGLVMTGDDVVVELPPEDTFGLESEVRTVGYENKVSSETKFVNYGIYRQILILFLFI